jgi:hypothetical protein
MGKGCPNIAKRRWGLGFYIYGHPFPCILLFYPEVGGARLLHNIDTCIPNYTVYIPEDTVFIFTTMEP